MNEIQRQNTLNVSMLNFNQAKKLCRTGTCFVLGSFVLSSFNRVELAWLKRFSTILGTGQLFLGAELAFRVHPEAPFNFFPNALSGKIYELKLFTPYENRRIIKFGWDRIRDVTVAGILAVFVGAPLKLWGHEVPTNDSDSGGVLGIISRTFQGIYQAAYEKTVWFVPTSSRQYFSKFRKFRNGYIEEVMFNDPTISNTQIITQLREICLQNTEGEIDSIFIGKKFFCSYDSLYDEEKCTDLYSRLEELRVMYGRWCSNSGNGDKTFNTFNFKEMGKRFSRWLNFRSSNKSYWEKIILGADYSNLRQKSNFEVPKTLGSINPRRCYN
jgi:hypothetical protein